MERSRSGFNILDLGRWLFLAFLLAFTAVPMYLLYELGLLLALLAPRRRAPVSTP